MRDHPNAVMMFAAGFGTRMRHLTTHQPKPMVKVAGRPLIDHALDLAQEIEPDKIVVNLHYKPEMLETHLKDQNVITLREMPDILDTGGGLRNALPVLGQGPVFTMNTDAIWRGPNPLKLLSAAWDPAKMDALMMCIPLENALGYTGLGDFAMGSDGQLTRGPGVIYSGVQIIKTELLANIPETVFSLKLIWHQTFAPCRLFGLRYPGKWCDVGHPEGIPLAESLIAPSHV